MQGAPGTPPTEDLQAADTGASLVWSPRVMAEFMTRIRTDDDPWIPNGMTLHSNCPSCDRKLVFHQSVSRMRT